MPARLRAALEGRTTLRKKLALNSEMPPRRRVDLEDLEHAIAQVVLEG